MLFHANASKTIGAGHLMRSLALAQALAENGHATWLVTCPESAPGLIAPWKTLGAKVVVESLQGPSANLAKRCLAWAEKSEAKWIVLDGYGFDSAYQRALKEAGYRLLVIDDTAHLPRYHADVLLNQNWNASHLSYGRAPGTVMLLGTRYTLLRQEFLQWKGWSREIPEVARHILVTLGGGEHGSVTATILDALKELDVPDLRVKVIHPDSSLDEDLAQDWNSRLRGRLEILGRVEGMAGLMAWADMAISGGGSTCWEMTYMGLPNLVIVLADNQEGVADSLDRLGCSIKVGVKETLSPMQVSEAAHALARDRERRRLMAQRGRALVDGLGAYRVVEHMAQMECCEGERQLCAHLGGEGTPG